MTFLSLLKKTSLQAAGLFIYRLALLISVLVSANIFICSVAVRWSFSKLRQNARKSFEEAWNDIEHKLVKLQNDWRRSAAYVLQFSLGDLVNLTLIRPNNWRP